MKRRVHPKVQMLHGARLALQHIRELSASESPEDLAVMFALIRHEVDGLTDRALSAYIGASSSAFRAAVRRG